MKLLVSLVFLAAIPSTAFPEDKPAPPQGPTLTLAPAVVMAKVKPGQGWTQTLRMSNGTGVPFRFDIEVQDVVIKDGKRTYAPAGETDGGIAASAVATPSSIVVPPQSEGGATVTFTIPQNTRQRAVVVYFRGKADTSTGAGSVALGGSLGALITFGLFDDYKVEAVNFATVAQSDTSNQSISHQLRNTGTEIVVPKGAAAILDDAGLRVAKTTFEARRLLPGELLTFSAVCPSQLKTGHYRVVSSFEFEGRVLTTGGEFSVP